jgi:hypothetical protein
MPNYGLGAKICWPDAINNVEGSNIKLEVYPNPASSILYIKHSKDKKIELYNCIGQMIYSTFLNEIDVSNYSKGIYYLRCGFQTKKIILE